MPHQRLPLHKGAFQSLTTAYKNCLHSSYEEPVQAVAILLNISPLRTSRIGQECFVKMLFFREEESVFI